MDILIIITCKYIYLHIYMDKLYLVGATLVILFFLMNKNIENFTLNFPENSLKCKCDMDDSDNEDDNLENNIENNNLVEKFSNYNNSKIEMPKKLDRIYNIHDIPYNESASSYYENKYYYPIKPLNNEVLFEASNSDKYKNIGTNNDKLLNNYNNNNIESYNYIFGINYEKNDIPN